MKEIVLMMHNREFGRAIASLEHEASDETKTLAERIECYKWLAECNLRTDDQKAGGDWYLEGVKLILAQNADNGTKARQALPLCDKALDCYKQGGESADVLVAARLRQYVISLAK